MQTSHQPHTPEPTKPIIRIHKQRGPGFWATITWPDLRIDAIQSAATYGFQTAAEARQAARNFINQTQPNT